MSLNQSSQLQIPANFNVPNNRVNSDIAAFDEEDFDEESDLLLKVAVSEDEVDKDVHLAAFDIK